MAEGLPTTNEGWAKWYESEMDSKYPGVKKARFRKGDKKLLRNNSNELVEITKITPGDNDVGGAWYETKSTVKEYDKSGNPTGKDIVEEAVEWAIDLDNQIVDKAKSKYAANGGSNRRKGRKSRRSRRRKSRRRTNRKHI